MGLRSLGTPWPIRPTGPGCVDQGFDTGGNRDGVKIRYCRLGEGGNGFAPGSSVEIAAVHDASGGFLGYGFILVSTGPDDGGNTYSTFWTRSSAWRHKDSSSAFSRIILVIKIARAHPPFAGVPSVFHPSLPSSLDIAASRMAGSAKISP